MQLIINKKLWTDYYVYEPDYNEFDSFYIHEQGAGDFIGLNKYHYLLSEYINTSSKRELIDAGFSADSAKKLKETLKWAKNYPVFEVFEEPANFYLSENEDGWQWEKQYNKLIIHKGPIQFVIENVDEEDGSSSDFAEINMIIEKTDTGEILRNDEITANDFIEGTTIIGFDVSLTHRYFFSKENVEALTSKVKSELEDLIDLIDHKDHQITSVDELIQFIYELT